MIKNHLKIAWRNMLKHKTFAFINIIGLSLGIAACFIILMYVQSELSYDRFNKNADRIERIQFKAVMNGGQIAEASVMAPVAAALKNDFPEVEDATRLKPMGDSKATYGTKSFKNNAMALADANFLNVFTLPLIQGDVNALAEPHTIIISKATAEKYFGNEDPIGKSLGFNNNTENFKVTGIYDKIPDNAHFHFDMIASMVDWKDAHSTSWMGGTFFTYVLLKPGTNPAALQAKFPAMVKKYMGPQIQQEMGISLEQFRTKGNELGFILQPLTAIHLHPNSTNEIEPAGNASYVYIFGVIGIFMLLIACINFINLSTAGASKRAKEIGVRKVIGSDRSQLIAQFLTESGVLVFAALTIAVVLIVAFLPAFNQISGKTFVFGLDFKLIAALIGLGLVVLLAAGIYPAFFLSSFKPIAVLKGKMTGNNKKFSMRSGLVVFQFFISVSLIVGTIVVYGQMKYIQSKDLGYNKDEVITIPNSWALGKNEKVFRDVMLRDPRVVNGALSWYKPAGPTNNNNALIYPQGHENTALKSIDFHVDEQYIPTLGIKMALGRNFSKDVATDSSAMIINEAAVAALGFTQANVIGQFVVQVNGDKGKNFAYHIVGVVKDFNFKSLHEAITPMLFTLEPEGGVIFKVHTTDLAGLLANMKKQWDSFNTDEPFTYTFLDDLYSKTYAAEQKTSTLLNIFSILTVIVACLGLFGLVTYTAEQRIKEIGIRKVLGASVTQITSMLSADFLRLVFIACLIAFPLSWWATNQWLQSFAYRMTIHWWVFALAAACALFIALITLSFQAIKAAIANPVKSLKTE
jgi:putative ABC transport system permease protein